MAASDIDPQDITSWLKLHEQLKSRRTQWDSHWREVSDFFWPSANGAFEGSGDMSRTGGGEKRTEKVFDTTGPLALDRGAGGLSSLVIPQAERWQTLRASVPELNADKEVQLWFEDVVGLLFEMRASPRANFYSQAHEGFMSELGFGNFCQFIDDSPLGGARYRNVHIGQVAIDTDEYGRVDTIFRTLQLNARQAMQKWGHIWREAPPDKIRVALRERPFELFDFVHIVTPRKNVDPERWDAKGKPWMGLYILPSERLLVEEGGFDEFPYVYPRWTVSPMETYGRGPAMLVLPTVKVLNSQEKTVLRAGHLAVNPPILFSSDGVFAMGSKNPRFVPGGSYPGMLDTRGQPLAQPLQTGAQIPLMFEMQQQKREAINAAFHLDLFQILVERPEMTATEVLERVAEKSQLLAPSIGRMQSEWFGPMTHRELGILGRQRLLPPMPAVLAEAGAGYEIEYQSPATNLQRTREITAVQRTVELLNQWIVVDPTVLKKFDVEDIIERSMGVMGGSSRSLLSRKQYASVLEAQAQQAAAAQQMQALQQGAMTAKDGAAALATMAETQQGAAA